MISAMMPIAITAQKQLPQFLAKTHEKFKTPYISIILTSVCILIFTIQASFISALTISTITRLIVYATTCLALPVFRQRKDVPKAEFKVPFDVLASMLSLILVVWLLSNVDYKKEGLVLLIVAAIGLIIYFANQFFQQNVESKAVINSEETKENL